ncbi:cryptochrome/photolyase family protein [Halomonas sp. 18H]|uniref:cryptochrome/photolyase family protein n=1 Tax=Halomonas almeriensis TaxID=308163 RepID=UPI002230F8F3|nr:MULTISPECIES: cryptochrome/photolyase family protein [Halomonas]MCW4149468.1 cryptochrome/photolyase family protein [Halomonas sp. 18H]MDN3553586.1 cryptochrome/photolyase family protein [Halomonas almeriensis]
MTRPLILIAGDQLTTDLAVLSQAPSDAVIALCEVAGEGRYVPHHPQKIALIFAAMRHFAAQLRQQEIRVHYSALDDPDNTQALIPEAERIASLYQCGEIRVTRPGEWRLWEAMQQRAKAALPWVVLEDERFFSTPQDFSDWAAGRKSLRMEYFYRMMRKRTGLLMEGAEPAGGKWNYDADNREPVPDHLDLPDPPEHRHDATTREVLELVETHFGEHFGRLEGFQWPVTRRQALVDLRHFIDKLLPDFGRYQDAISDDQPFLFHSRLSASLNIGLLSPREVCESAEAAYYQGAAPLNAVEGFIRQILGWREYVRGLYWTRMPSYKQSNTLHAERGLPDFYWTGDTDMRCLSRAIRMTHDNAYAHHIQRLMVTGNFALLCGVAPSALCDWYLAVYADACEWVELPNTLGMVLHADGGLMGSKPYCASGKYINRMSDHCAQCRYDPGKTLGEDACPLNSLYWHFLERNRHVLADNHRMKPIYGNLARMSSEKRDALRDQAEDFLENLKTEAAYGQGTHRQAYEPDR